VTIAELIAKLSTLDPDLVVTVSCEHSGFSYPHTLYGSYMEQVTTDGTRIVTIGQSYNQLDIPHVYDDDEDDEGDTN
jgi:hypothetical protein